MKIALGTKNLITRCAAVSTNKSLEGGVKCIVQNPGKGRFLLFFIFSVKIRTTHFSINMDRIKVLSKPIFCQKKCIRF